MRLTRADRSLVSDWWFSIDRGLLLAVLALMVIGAVLSPAASPAAAQRVGGDTLYFVKRHALFLLPALALFLTAAMLDPRQMRRLALGLCGPGMALMIAALIQGVERNGAVRWLELGLISIQPSEFVKPGFVILAAWLFAESERRRDMPVLPLAVALLAAFAALLVAQPDFGQAVLVALIWGGLFFLTGYSLIWIGLAGGVAAAGLVAAYVAIPHVASRVDRFLNPALGDTRQTDLALEAFRQGGWFGRGPGEGAVKMVLPDAHTDYVFAVIAEEFGVIACLVLVMLYGFIIWRGLAHAQREPDGFIRLGVTGLMMLFGFQTLINMAVNVGLLPAKGMTLPFLSYGGSSLLAMSVTMALVLGLTRRRPMAGLAYRPFGRGIGGGAASSGGIRI